MQNVAVAGSDGANASFIGTTGDMTNNGGTISNLAPGASDNSSLMVGIDTATSGVKTGTTTVQLETDGVVTGNPEIFGTTEVTTTGGTVYNFAAATVNNAPVTLANAREGATSEQALSITNSAPDDGFTENLNATGNGTTGDATVAGSFTGLGAQATDTTNVVVGLDTATAGAKAGTATVDFVSDGTGINSLGQTALASQQVNVSGNVFRLAEAGAHTPEPVVLADSHVGDTAEQALSMTNTAANDGFSESLNASIGAATGDATATGSFNLLAAQASDSSNLVVGIDTSTAGAKAGTATISSESDGTGTSGITPNVMLADQTVNVSGDVYRLATASAHTPEPVVLADSHVGDIAQQALTLGNTATADGFSENLNASFGAATGNATASGSIAGLTAGGSDNSSLLVGVDTSAAGARSGSVALNLESDGDGINSLGQTAMAGQTVNVSGDVFNLAQASAHSPEPVNLGNVHVGDAATQALTLGNTAAAGAFSENLNASFGAPTGDATATGSISGLAAGGSDNSSLVVGINTATAGAKSGTAALNLESDGTGINSLGQTALAGQTVNVSGNVFRLAEAQVTPDLVTLNARVGDVVSQTLTVANTAANDGFSESLAVTSGSASGDAGLSGVIGGLIAAGGSDNNLSASLDTSSAGAKSGSIDLTFESDGAGTSGLGTTGLSPGSVTVQGNVYQAAVAGVDATPIDFGIVHVGDVVTLQNIGVSNTASVAALNDLLTGGVSAVDGPFTDSGDLGSGVAAGAADSSSINVGLDTGTSGMFTGNATLSLASSDADLADLDLGDFDVALSAQVNEFANPVFDFVSGDGSFSGGGMAFEIDLGNIVQGGSRQSRLRALNDVIGIADLLDGDFLLSGGVFSLSGFDSFIDLAAGDSAGPLLVGLDTSALSLGLVTGNVILQATGHNASGFSQDFTDITLALRANVVQQGGNVPEPPTSVILLLAIGLTLRLARRRRTSADRA